MTDAWQDGSALPARPRRPDERLLVLVVERDVQLRERLVELFHDRGMRVSSVATGAEALRLLGVHAPHLVILDLGIGDYDGLALCRRFAATLRCPIIALCDHDDVAQMVFALDNGADDCLARPVAIELLMARVRVAMRHAAALASRLDEDRLAVGDLVVDVPAHLATADGVPLELSPRQFRLLTAFVRNVDRVLSHQQLAQVGAGDFESRSADTVRPAISLLRKRLGDGPRRPKIVTEAHIGYRLSSRPMD